MGMRWDGQERRINHTTRRRIEQHEDRVMVRALLVGCAIGLLGGVPTGYILDKPKAAEVPTPRVELSTETLLDATTIEIRGYDESGKPGTFVHDCEYEGERLVCTQREAP